MAFATVCAISQVVNGNYEAAAAWFCVAAWTVNTILARLNGEYWRKRYFKALGLDEDTAES